MGIEVFILIALTPVWLLPVFAAINLIQTIRGK